MGFYETDSEQAEAYREVHEAPQERQLSTDVSRAALIHTLSARYFS